MNKQVGTSQTRVQKPTSGMLGVAGHGKISGAEMAELLRLKTRLAFSAFVFEIKSILFEIL